MAPFRYHLLFFGLLGLALPLACTAGVIVLPPSNATRGEAAALVFLQGAFIAPEAYMPLMQAIQAATPLSLWAALPRAPLDAVEPMVVGRMIEESLQALKAAGCACSMVFVGGHSLGGAMVQGWAKTHAAQVKGQVLMGSTLLRIHRNDSYPVPTATVAAGLDGMFRVTRAAEEHYHRVLRPSTPDAHLRFPVIVVPGMSHMQFASGKPPRAVVANDLAPEIPNEEAQRRTAEAVASFLIVHATHADSAVKALARLVEETTAFLRPIVAAFELEGSRRFNRPQQVGGPDEQCPKGGCVGGGSPWVPVAQRYIGLAEELEKEGWTITVHDQYVKLNSSPPFGEFHLPEVTHDPTRPKAFHVSTYTQSAWEEMDSADVGSAPISAAEVGAKMMSRQCILVRGANRSAAATPFTLDDPDFCAEVNLMAYEWALNTTSPEARARFAAKGQALTFASDHAESQGPSWIWTRLKFTPVDLPNQRRGLQVTSPMLKSSIDLPRIPPFPDVACYHYCKLLSPARAMEWVFVDGLKHYGGLAPPPPAGERY